MSEGTKNDQGKLPFALLPVEPLKQLVQVYQIGAKKYSDHNWRKGFKYSRIFSALQRHAWDWWGGEELDQEDGQHHLASVAWCALTLLEFLKTHPSLDDRYKQGGTANRSSYLCPICKYVPKPGKIIDMHEDTDGEMVWLCPKCKVWSKADDWENMHQEENK